MWRSTLLQARGAHSVMHLTQFRQLRGAGGASRNMLLDVVGMAGVELIVDQRIEQDLGVIAVHGIAPSAPFHAARSIDRARASRDITVPTGTPATSAIS